MTPRHPWAVRIARALHAMMLVLVDRRVRAAYRHEMIATFELASAEAARRGLASLCALLLREVVDLARAQQAVRPVPLPVSSPPMELAGRRAWVNLDMSAWQQAWRALRRRPGYAIGAIVTLGTGVGLTTTAFVLVDTIVLQPLPYPSADQLVSVYESSPAAREQTSLIAPARLADWNRLATSFVALSGSYAENVTDTSGPDPERLGGRRVAPRFFDVYAAPPLAGRTFTAEEERAGGPMAAVISEGLWAARFQRSPAAIGRLLSIGSTRVPIVGVMPASFAGRGVDIWLPAQIAPALMQIREARFFGGVGRVREGVTIDAAARDLAAVQAALGREFPASDAGWSVEVTPLKDARVGTTRDGLVLVFGAVIALWLIAVANTMGLVFVHMRRRARELAIRGAVGASQTRLVTLVVRETALVAVIALAAGIALSLAVLPLVSAAFSTTPRIDELSFNWRGAVFAVGTVAAAAGALSVVALIAVVRARNVPVMGLSGTRIAAGGHALQRITVVAQVALSVVLVGAASLMVQSYYALSSVKTGLDASDVITFHVGVRWDEDRARVGRFQVELLRRLEALPHVTAAGMTNFLPATGATLRFQVDVDGVTGPNADGTITTGARMISAGYLRAIRAPLLAGEWCPEPVADLNTRSTAMVNRQFIDVHAPNQALVGRNLRVAPTSSDVRIVGVIDDLAEDGHARGPAPYVYACNPAGSWPDPEYVARTADAKRFVTDLRQIVRELEPGRAVFAVRPLADVLDVSLARPRRDAAVMTLFGSAAVLLAALALYSLFALVVAERTGEIAIRLAIGAAPRQLRRQVIGKAAPLLGAGLLLGMALTTGAERVFRAWLIGQPLPGSFVSILIATTLLTLVGIAAVSIPAIRASRIEPLAALRGDH